jgi:hypothetical protein
MTYNIILKTIHIFVFNQNSELHNQYTHNLVIEIRKFEFQISKTENTSNKSFEFQIQIF